MRKILVLALLIFGLVFASSAFAQTKLSAALGNLTWGMSHEQALKQIEESMMDDFRSTSKGVTDLAYIDKLRKTTLDKIEDVKKSYIVLNQDNSGIMSVSVVGDQFMPGNSESVLVVKDSIATKYYFFEQNKFYKLVIVYDPAYIENGSFEMFLEKVTEKYGKAKNEVYNDELAFFEKAVWKNSDGTGMMAINKMMTYKTFTMNFYHEATESKLATKHAEFFKTVNAMPAVSSDIDDLTKDVDTADEANAVDSILGKETKVDLLAGLSQKDLDIIHGVKKESEAEKKKKKKGAKAKKSKSKIKATKNELSIY